MLIWVQLGQAENKGLPTKKISHRIESREQEVWGRNSRVEPEIGIIYFLEFPNTPLGRMALSLVIC
jgi:hypothetical protein